MLWENQVFKEESNMAVEFKSSETKDNLMRAFAGESQGYPVDIPEDLGQLLRMAQHNEYEEHDDVYKKFGEKAMEEGFTKVANSFRMIAEIEKVHGDRFGRFAEYLEQNKLYVSDVRAGWMCLNCGYIFEGEKVPEKCPVCDHDKGYFIRVSLSPFTDGQKAWA